MAADRAMAGGEIPVRQPASLSAVVETVLLRETIQDTLCRAIADKTAIRTSSLRDRLHEAGLDVFSIDRLIGNIIASDGDRHHLFYDTDYYLCIQVDKVYQWMKEAL